MAKPKRIRIVYTLGIGLFILFGSCFFLPQMISSDWGKAKIEGHLETLLGGKVSIETLTLSWSGYQSCHQVQWKDEKKGIALTADFLNISANLIDCLKYKDKPLNVVVEGAKMSCNANLKLLKIYDQTQIDLHFSPIRALIQEGMISFERTNIDITQSLQVITWGTIDLEKNRMDMTLGLPPKTLNNLFNASNLADDYLLEIPISSKLNSKALEKKLISFFIINPAVKWITKSASGAKPNHHSE